MERRLDLDYCPTCDLPTFNCDEVALVTGEFLHKYCFNRSKMVAKMEDLRARHVETE